MPSSFLLYGSYGYVGDLIARRAVEHGLRPILAGRNAARLAAQAAELGLEYHPFSLEDAAAVDRALEDVTAVLHCAGPFIHTYKAMADACRRMRKHYLDITGEIPVFEALAARDAEAAARGIMILPGVGFGVAPTDCLAAHLKRRLPSATHLTLAFMSKGSPRLSRGSVNTGVETILPHGGKVRRDGRLVTVPHASKSRMIDFGHGRVNATLAAWGDVFTAFYSTGIPNIEVYAVTPKDSLWLLTGARYLRPLFGLPAVKNFLKRGIQAQPLGPTAEERVRTSTLVWGEVRDNQGRQAVSRLHGPQGYTWTALTAVAAVEKVLAGNAPPGFQTPSLAYGADFALECEGVTREDMEKSVSGHALPV